MLKNSHSTSKMAKPLLLPHVLGLKRWSMVLTILLLIGAARSAVNNRWEECFTSTSNFTTGEPYETGLTLLFASLSFNTPITGFFNDTKGSTPDLVYGLALCRGDLTLPSECKACIETAVKDLKQVCSGKKSATIWYDDCLVRYSDKNFFGIPRGYRQSLVNSQNSTIDAVIFNKAVRDLVVSVTRTAAAAKPSGSSPGLYAVEEANLSNSSKLYSMAQCTRDISSDDCLACLEDDMKKYIGSYPYLGLRNLAGSCFIRYESGPFYSIPKRATVAAPPQTSGGDRTNTPSLSPQGQKKKRSKKKILLIIVPLLVFLLVLMMAIFICLRNQRSKKKRAFNKEHNDLNMEDLSLLNLSILKKATDDFSNTNKLGQGGFGPVYKGLLEDGQEIAVKRLARGSRQGLAELRNEVLFVARLQHRNLVKLLGWCLEEDEMILVYEYMPNASLDKIIYDSQKSQLLTWETRFKIIEGVVRGLLYLHEESRLTIVHRDLKASNILLDIDMNPKISDFGLAKLFEGDNTYEATSRVAGTFGYMAPEYVMHGKFSTKSDVYSFGVLVLELVTGQRNSKFHANGAVDLLNHVLQHWKHGNIANVMDPNLIDKCPILEVSRCIHIALLCVQEDPLTRPSMSSVVLMLSSQSTCIEIPGNIAWGITSTTTMNDNNLDTMYDRGEEIDQPKKEAIYCQSSCDTLTTLEPR